MKKDSEKFFASYKVVLIEKHPALSFVVFECPHCSEINYHQVNGGNQFTICAHKTCRKVICFKYVQEIA